MILPSPNPGPIGNPNDLNTLGGVTCVAASDCAAAGRVSTINGVSKTLIETAAPAAARG